MTLRADPVDYLYPLIQTWPLPSRSGETLLVERRGQQVLYLNELRFRQNTALKLAPPANRPSLPAAMAVRGRRGVVQGIDYRGVPVLAALQTVPGAPWFIVAKEDTNEVLGSTRARGWLTAGIALVLVALAGLGTLLLWRARELQTSAEIRESEERYRALVEHAPMPILVNREGHVVLANQACLRLFGASAPDQLLGKSLFDLFHPDSHSEIREHLDRLRHEGEEVPQIEQRIVRLDGSSVDVEVAAAPFRDQGVDSVHVVLNDITKRKRAEEAVREAARYARNLLETSLDPLVTISSTGKITDVNTAAERITGKSREGIIDSDFADYFTDPEAARAVYLKAFSAGQVIDYPLDIRHSSGAITEVLYNASVYRDEQGEVLGVFAAARDVTERNRAQDEIRRLNAELEQRVLDRTAQLDAANEELEAFAYSVSHDLRAPLRHISGFSSLLAERAGDDLDEKSRHYVDTISRSVREMGVLIDDLLEFSRTGRTELTIEPVDMDATLAEALEPLRRETGDRDIEWSIGPLPAVVGDHALLRQVWANLLGNAVKYTRGRTPAVIEVGAREGDGADEDVFYVLDNGAGFDMQYAHKLFGVFQRLHSSAEFEGTGIGLANVQRIINRLGGRVWAEAELDHGATFTFALPRRKETPS